MAIYNADQVHTAFEILSRSGKLSEVMGRLAEAGFSLKMSDDHAKAVAAELRDALGHLEATEPNAHAELLATLPLRDLKGTTDCPCRSV